MMSIIVALEKFARGGKGGGPCLHPRGRGREKTLKDAFACQQKPFNAEAQPKAPLTQEEAEQSFIPIGKMFCETAPTTSRLFLTRFQIRNLL
jgi:hypothetical protein